MNLSDEPASQELRELVEQHPSFQALRAAVSNLRPGEVEKIKDAVQRFTRSDLALDWAQTLRDQIKVTPVSCEEPYTMKFVISAPPGVLPPEFYEMAQQQVQP